MAHMSTTWETFSTTPRYCKEPQNVNRIGTHCQSALSVTESKSGNHWYSLWSSLLVAAPNPARSRILPQVGRDQRNQLLPAALKSAHCAVRDPHGPEVALQKPTTDNEPSLLEGRTVAWHSCDSENPFQVCLTPSCKLFGVAISALSFDFSKSSISRSRKEVMLRAFDASCEMILVNFHRRKHFVGEWLQHYWNNSRHGAKIFK
ncbi:hypothetical protein HYFRA_00000979 [Hymenoscyphus fraxineus]|uniref:Uncharacterized protein n=1 Tax=Hymenoscyphus fraxineus TaxID=746836 RepID=A0A9N9KRM2_9HELO|nr:hypothetical protein HYFRA_00000979 [Hymenoscyphus fraxineus]